MDTHSCLNILAAAKDGIRIPLPTAVAEAGSEGVLPKQALSTYWKWLVGDAVKLGKQEAYLREVMTESTISSKEDACIWKVLTKRSYNLLQRSFSSK